MVNDIRVAVDGGQFFSEAKDSTIDCSVHQDLWIGILRQIRDESRIKEIHFRRLDRAFEQIVGIGTQKENDPRFLKDGQPAFRDIVRDAYVLRNVVNVQHLPRPTGGGANTIRVQQFVHARDLIGHVAVGIIAAAVSLHRTPLPITEQAGTASLRTANRSLPEENENVRPTLQKRGGQNACIGFYIV